MFLILMATILKQYVVYRNKKNRPSESKKAASCDCWTRRFAACPLLTRCVSQGFL
jgi:hypothetical protein